MRASAVSFYIIALGTEIQQTWMPNVENVRWTVTWVSSVCLFICLLVSLAGGLLDSVVLIVNWSTFMRMRLV